MAKQQTRATELARLLNSTSRPIYVLDDEQTLIFCNRACLDWVRLPADELLGRRCAYHSSPDVSGADAVAAGLCPPPAAMAGEPTTATIARTLDGRIHRRRARFIPLGDRPEELIALVAVVDAEDIEVPEATAPSVEEPDALHDRLRQLRRLSAGRYRLERLVGDSPAIRRARRQVELAAGSRASVLIVGPPGSGRQHLASTIHYAHGEGSLIPLACSTLGAELIESTVAALAAGPLRDRAADGTLLLNDADRIPPEAQAELAGVISGKSPLPRVIATAREPLVDLARRGEYQDELAAVLGTIVIELPPLARRRGDLPLLAQLFLEEENVRGTKQLGGFTSEALDLLDAYPWPGNVDELVRMVTEAHQHAEGPEIGPGDLPRRIHLAAEAAARPRRVEETIVLDKLLGRIERELIGRALARAKGNKSKAARLLGMTRPRLYRRLVQLGLEEDSE